jgi:hypothetical protein
MDGLGKVLSSYEGGERNSFSEVTTVIESGQGYSLFMENIRAVRRLQTYKNREDFTLQI